MKTYVLCVLAGLMLVAPSLVAQTNGAAKPAIPEEARKHFVMGETMFKEAKSAANFSQAAAEFTDAAKLAPQWPDARYNLALAKEAAGDYSGAMDDLKLYQQFKLSEAEARTVQDKIYAISAKQQMKAADQKAADEANSPSAQLEKLIKSLDGGVWRCVASSTDDRVMGHQVDRDVGRGVYISVSGHMISGHEADNFQKTVTEGNPLWTMPITSRRFNATWSYTRWDPADFLALDQYTDEITISDDGRSITENRDSTNHDTGGYYHFIIKRTYTRDR